MHFDPDPALPLVEFESPGLTRNRKMPVMTTSSARKFALAPHHESPTAALPESPTAALPECLLALSWKSTSSMR